MCVIKMVEMVGVIAVSSPADAVKPWKRFDCSVRGHVDGGELITAQIRTFSVSVRDFLEQWRVPVGQKKPKREPVELNVGVFERGDFISYSLEPKENPKLFPKEAKKAAIRAGQGVATVRPNRQVALECAARVIAGCGYVSGENGMPLAAFTILEAEKLLVWLEGGKGKLET